MSMLDTVREAGATGGAACIPFKGHTGPTGYGQCWYLGKVRGAHRVAYHLKHGTFPNTVRHTCDNPSCINPEHLVAGTQADNMADKVERGRQCRGAKHPDSKLTLEQVHEIRKQHEHGRGGNTRTLAERYGVHPNTILGIGRKATWREHAE